jgi:hypothetical protein
MRRVVLIFALAVAAGSVEAGTVTDLYEATVPVDSRTEADRTAAVRAALRQVLVKISGDPNAASYEGANTLIGDAPRLMQQYQYVENLVTGGAAGLQPRLGIRVRFDPAVLEEALRATALPIWGRERPSVLLWLAVDDTQVRGLIGTDDPGGYADVVRHRASQRGVPLILPLLDLEDARYLDGATGGAIGGTAVLAASERYGADAILTGGVSSVGAGVWEGRWRLQLGEEVVGWTSRGALAGLVLEQGIDRVAAELAARFARAGAAREVDSLELVVRGVHGADDYARVQKYLQSLGGVTDLMVKEVQADAVTFQLSARGGREALAQSIALGTTLQASGFGGRGDSYLLLPR